MYKVQRDTHTHTRREHSHKQSDVLFLNTHLLTELLWEAAADTSETTQRSLTNMPRFLGEGVLGKKKVIKCYDAQKCKNRIAHTHAHTHTHMHTHTHTHTHAHAHTHAHTYTHIHMHTHACTHTHVHALTHTHAHIQLPWPPLVVRTPHTQPTEEQNRPSVNGKEPNQL